MTNSPIPDDREAESLQETEQLGEAANPPHQVVPVTNYHSINKDVLNVSNFIVHHVEKAANAAAASQSLALPAPTSSTTPTPTPAPASPSLNTTSSSQASARLASFNKKVAEARSYHAEDDFAKNLFLSVRGRNPHEGPK